MSIRVDLDNRLTTFTCFDHVCGKVVLNLPSDDTVSSVTVKMEGISRTRLEPPGPEETGGPIPPGRPRERRRAEVEVHRILYLVQTVFPPAAIRDQAAQNASYTLKAGQYEYPFRIIIPANTACTEGVSSGPGGLLHKLSFDNGTVDFARSAKGHKKGTLPPSLSGIPGDAAWIRYFLKVTVNRPKLFKTNLRQIDPFVFLPIEPPRPAPSLSETFARRRHEFMSVAAMKSPKKSLFSFSRSTPEDRVNVIPIRYYLEARLPSPPIVVPNDPLPLRILYTKTEPFPEVVTMRSLQITLLATTHIIAHEIFKDELTTTSILSIADLHIPLGTPNMPAGAEIELDRTPWANRSLPDTIPPSFETCNITRSYRLQVDVGVSRGNEHHVDTLMLILPLHVYSGIPPSQALLDRLATHTTPQPSAGATMGYGPGSDIKKRPVPSQRTQTLNVPKLSIPRPGSSDGRFAGPLSAKTAPLSPTVVAERPHSSYESSNQHHLQAMGGGFGPPPGTPGMGGQIGGGGDMPPPPAYEDAIADDIAPVDGPRRQYAQGEGYYGALPEDLARH
ncbi:hypothetical protein EDC01DRAFT_674459 [Geopyxis carbonaria]|nr:hypothetical protein EDC01DRAFT_674459 [Geopyxis carbonaria]